MTQPLQQRRFRRISASALRSSEKVQLSRIESRLRTFQRAIDEVRSLPITHPKVWLKKRISRRGTPQNLRVLFQYLHNG